MGVRIEIEVFIYRETELVPHAWWFGDCKHRNVKKVYGVKYIYIYMWK
jgi:hypothetical protein